MSAVKVKPLVPIPKRIHGFSIDSIMSRDDHDRNNSSSEDSDPGEEQRGHSPTTDDDMFSVGSRIPPLHPSLPAHVQQLLLREASSHTGRPSPEHLLALQSQAWAFGSQQAGSIPGLGLNAAAIGGLTPQLGPRGPLQAGFSTHPNLLAAAAMAGRDPLSMYPPWMLNKHGPGLLGYPFGKFIFIDFFHALYFVDFLCVHDFNANGKKNSTFFVANVN